VITLDQVHLKPCLHRSCLKAGAEVLHAVIVNPGEDRRPRTFGHLASTANGHWTVAYETEAGSIWTERLVPLGTMPTIRDAVVLLTATANASDAMHDAVSETLAAATSRTFAHSAGPSTVEFVIGRRPDGWPL
jgi:hypothetical protein